MTRAAEATGDTNNSQQRAENAHSDPKGASSHVMFTGEVAEEGAAHTHEHPVKAGRTQGRGAHGPGA